MSEENTKTLTAGVKKTVFQAEYTQCPFFKPSPHHERRLETYSRAHDDSVERLSTKICGEGFETFKEVEVKITLRKNDSSELVSCRGRVDLVCLDKENKRALVVEYKTAPPAFMNSNDIYQLAFYCSIISKVLGERWGQGAYYDREVVEGNEVSVIYEVSSKDLLEFLKDAGSGLSDSRRFNVVCKLIYGGNGRTNNNVSIPIDPGTIDKYFFDPVKACYQHLLEGQRGDSVKGYVLGRHCWDCGERKKECPIFQTR